MRSFDDLFNDIWRPQAIAFYQVIYQIQPPASDLNSMSERQHSAYLAEVRRLRGELERENPVLTRMLRPVILSS